VSFLVHLIGYWRFIHMMSSREHLCSLQDHLDAVLVAVHLSSDQRVGVQYEYVHALDHTNR
jgi:hypothetical protein